MAGYKSIYRWYISGKILQWFSQKSNLLFLLCQLVICDTVPLKDTLYITAVTFLEYWKRKNASLAHHWDVSDYEEEEVRFRKWSYLPYTQCFLFSAWFNYKENVYWISINGNSLIKYKIWSLLTRRDLDLSMPPRLPPTRRTPSHESRNLISRPGKGYPES